MVFTVTMKFICASQTPKKDGGFYSKATFLRDNETLEVNIPEESYNRIKSENVSPMSDCDVAIRLYEYQGNKNFACAGVMPIASGKGGK